MHRAIISYRKKNIINIENYKSNPNFFSFYYHYLLNQIKKQYKLIIPSTVLINYNTYMYMNKGFLMLFQYINSILLLGYY